MFVVTSLLACGPVHTAADAPFSVRGTSMLFMVDASTTPLRGTSLLLATDDEISCDVMASGATLTALDELFQQGGRGIALLAEYVDPSEDLGADPWPGLYSGTAGVGREGASRTLVPSVYDGGFAYLARDAASSWMRLDSVGDDVKGEFHTSWWGGRIQAQRCDLGGDGLCSVQFSSAFPERFVDRYCDQWASCGIDSACPLDNAGLQDSGTAPCADFDGAVASECLCGNWTCSSEEEGFEYPIPPFACSEVCGGAPFPL